MEVESTLPLYRHFCVLLYAFALDLTPEELTKLSDQLLLFRDPRTVPPLPGILQNPASSLREHQQSALRIAAARLLGEIGRPGEVTSALIDALSDSEPGVRNVAAVALGQLRDRRAVPALVARLDDSQLEVRCMAVLALGEIGGPDAIAAVAELSRASDLDGRLRSALRSAF